MSEEPFRPVIAERLKACRRERKMSLDAVAEATGVSKAMLGQIERQESAPTIATLWKIASGLGISFSLFFADGTGPELERAPFPNDPQMAVSVLFPYDPATRMEMFTITLTGNHRQISAPHRFGVVEHVVVLSGELELVCEGEVHRLKPGGTLRFHADVPHEYRSVTDSAVFQNIICYT
ncbi:helix-turn-helix domain-containing protein [Pseudodesulfovibrio indicus]|uniref:XRE family transcriptional regulator n=1 Tax=Pseudodesulfovibrio indicus TaxID=1716143 RepID=A0A126QQS4_9BACT|nr:XRE family transcriptional regulator [Pseudodesulfovibrio indicus]AMK12087.1 XRE family transcriptional regulator [Pseudodesulfovibrio indicus]TDT88687.1 XRE family transcriptional regulator [Pseudodesulfovibrio indicus]